MNTKSQTTTKGNIISIIKVEEFQIILKKLTINQTLNDDEKEYILTCALIFLEYYKRDKRNITYCEFSYYIILKYSVIHTDYQPLYDFSTNLGFYPISKFILDKKLINTDNLYDFLIKIQLDKFNNWEYIETLEQKKVKNTFLKDISSEVSYIAPTSYWKSSLIIEYLNAIKDWNHKIWIIVPSKSLLAQTHKLIQKSWINKKILIHDEMYSNEDSFIAIFTQERALRLLKKHPDIHFDILFIDEAHNLLDRDSRSLLLSRLILWNLKLNPNCKNIYLSPLVTDSNNLKLLDSQNIKNHSIHFNIKEPELFEYTLSNKIYQHNRFFVWWWRDYEWYNIWEWLGAFNYIVNTASKKNFLYHWWPKKVELIAIRLNNEITNIKAKAELSNKITDLVNILEKQVHKDFYWIDTIKNWIVYIHGQMPDLIKEYLELKFKQINELKYIIANSVILEWVNLPIDSLYILHTRWLSWKDLTNLIGRVNRLNNIFSLSNCDLSLLLPKVYFVHSEFESKSDTRQINKIKLLRNKIFDDEIKNPILKEYNIEKNLSWEPEDRDRQKKNIEKIQEDEKFLYIESEDERTNLKKYLIENWIHSFYKTDYFEKVVDLILINIKTENLNDKIWKKTRILDKIHFIFINWLYQILNKEYNSYISDYEIKRLAHKSTRDYYEYFIEISLKQSLNDYIKSTYDYFKTRVNLSDSKDRKFYFWESYWDVVYDSESYPNSVHKVYVDVKWKSDKELINLAVVKIKLEENFISFKLNKFIVFLYDYKLISEEEYNTYVYWTNNKEIINLINGWLNSNLVKRLQNDRQLSNITFDKNGNLKWNDDFIKYKDNIDDFYKFELERCIN